MSITNKLNQIKNAIYGKEVRGAIHDAIKQVYDDASVNHDNANMEVKMARGTHNTLNDRLDNVDEIQAQTNAQLSHKINKGEGGVITNDMLSQEVKEAMTGGSVAVVGKNAILNENIVDKEVTANKTDFAKYINLFDNYQPQIKKYLENNVGVSTITSIGVSSGNNNIVAILEVVDGAKLTIKKGSAGFSVYLYDAGGVLRSFKDYSDGDIITIDCTVTGYTIGYMGVTSTVLDHVCVEYGTNPDDVTYKETSQNIYEVRMLEEKLDKYEPKDGSICPHKTNFAEFVNVLECEEPLIGYFLENNIGTSTINSISSSVYGLNIIGIIEVNDGETFSVDNANGAIKVALYDTNGILRSFEERTSVGITFKCSVEGYTIKYFGLVAESLNVKCFKGDRILQNVAEKETYQNIYQVRMLEERIANISNISQLTGKKVACFGDSITYGAENGAISYVNLLADRNQMTVLKYAVSGAVFVPTKYPDREGYRSVILDQVNKFITENRGTNVDYCIISGGYNDSQDSIRNSLGTVTVGKYDGNYDTNTVAGSLEKCIYNLMTEFPSIKICGVITFKAHVGFQAYRNILKEVYEKWGIKVVDLTVSTNMVAGPHPLQNKYFMKNDGSVSVHPNNFGQTVMSLEVERVMNEIF